MADSLATAVQVSRGLCRLFWQMGAAAVCEAPLANGQRADVLALMPDGRLALVEVKVSLADLRSDAKWTRYLDYCDRFYWAAPPGFPLDLFGTEAFGAGRAGLIVADAFEAAILAPAAEHPLPAARRKAALIRFGMAAASRLMTSADPELTRSAAA